MTDPFVPPAWLGKTPSGDFRDYGDPDGKTWLHAIRINLDSVHESLYDVHTHALKGHPKCLEAMRLYYVALTTKRLKS